MSVRVTCPYCEESWQVDSGLAGSSIRCRACEKRVKVPGGETEDEAEEEEASVRQRSLKKRRRARSSEGDSGGGSGGAFGIILSGLLMIVAGIGVLVATAWVRINPAYGIALIVLGVLLPLKAFGVFGGE
jgi:hypothetical protein